MDDFLFHKLSEKEKDGVREKAKKILSSFSEKISKIKIPDKESVIIRNKYEREEGSGTECDESFKNMMFENAPDKNKEFIITERKKWE